MDRGNQFYNANQFFAFGLIFCNFAKKKKNMVDHFFIDFCGHDDFADVLFIVQFIVLNEMVFDTLEENYLLFDILLTSLGKQNL